MHLYQRIRDIREDHDLTQSQIGQILQIKYQQYARYESGEREIHLPHIITLARFYNISIDYIAGLIDTPEPLYRKNKRP